MIAGVATDTMVESTRIMKKPRQSAKSAGHGSLASRSGPPEVVVCWVTAPLNHRAWTMLPMTFQDLMAGPPPTHLPVDPAAAELEAGSPAVDVVRTHPESPLAWATLAEQALETDGTEGLIDVTAYAYARVGYHRSLDLLRRNGWKGNGPVPWEHEPNRGFLRALAALARAADRIGEDPEAQRCSEFLRDSSPAAYEALLG